MPLTAYSAYCILAGGRFIQGIHLQVPATTHAVLQRVGDRSLSTMDQRPYAVIAFAFN